jgi:hypothetical protein
MKVKLNALVNAKESLIKLGKTDLPVKTAYALNKDFQKMNIEFKAYEEAKMKLFDKYGEKQPDEKIIIKPENIKTFQKEIGELLETEVEIDLWKVKLENLGDVKFSALELGMLEFLIEE